MSNARPLHSIEALVQELHQLGIRPGDTVMVHASLRAVGPTEERADGVVKALLIALGNAGTLLSYTDYLATDEVPYFDPSRSPAQPDHGILAEVIRTWPGARRSLNPGASMSVLGAQADWLAADHPLSYGYGPGSPLHKFVSLNGKVLLLGSDLDNVTLLHLAEHLAALPGKRVIHPVERMWSPDGLQEVQYEEFDTSEPILDGMPENYFSILVSGFIEYSSARSGKIGQATAWLLSAPELLRYAVTRMEREFGQMNAQP